MESIDDIGLWTLRSSCPIPKKVQGQVPLLQSIKSYELNIEGETLQFDRIFNNCEESSRIFYNGRELNEIVYIHNGVITDVASEYNPTTFPEDNDSEEVYMEKLKSFFDRKKTRVPQYHNIKRFSTHLGMLSERYADWKQDIDVILNGSGEYIK